MIDGGATVGNWATGSCLIATPPKTMMKSAITHAKMGRSMKNCAIASVVQRDAAAEAEAEGEAEAEAATEAVVPAAAEPGGRCARRLPRDRLHGRVAAQLLEAIDHHHLAGLQALEDDPGAGLCRADPDRPARDLAVAAHRP
jgi:hypothetical protein